MSYLLIAVLFSVRPVDPTAVETLDLAVNRSAVVRLLIDELERSNLIIHLLSSLELPQGIGGTTRFVTSRGGYRYLRITIAAQLPRDLRVAILAHELQHAREMAESSADNAVALIELFATIGRRNGGFFETEAAIRVERSVRMELRGRSSPAEPAVKFRH
jgi:hypothetical protein